MGSVKIGNIQHIILYISKTVQDSSQ